MADDGAGDGAEPVDEATLQAAVEALDAGDLVVYPTETVYGLGADALDPAAVERVFSTKRRDRDQPVSLAVHDVAAIDEYAVISDRERAFCDRFLPGPVTVVLAARDQVPRELTGGRDRVGVRVPDHAIARQLAERVGPLTATSANVSGRPSARRVSDLDDEIREAAAVVLDGGETPGGGSTVVAVAAETIIRRGAQAEAIEAWLGT